MIEAPRPATTSSRTSRSQLAAALPTSTPGREQSLTPALPVETLSRCGSSSALPQHELALGKDDDQERTARLLLLGKGAVLAHRLARPLAAGSDEEERPASALPLHGLEPSARRRCFSRMQEWRGVRSSAARHLVLVRGEHNAMSSGLVTACEGKRGHWRCYWRCGLSTSGRATRRCRRCAFASSPGVRRRDPLFRLTAAAVTGRRRRFCNPFARLRGFAAC